MEWDELAEWVLAHELAQENVRFVIQLERCLEQLYEEEAADISSYQDVLRNTFLPLFEVRDKE